MNGYCPKIHKHQTPKTQVQEVHFHGSPISSTHGPSNSHSIPQLNISWKVSVWFSYWVVGMWFHDPGSLHIANQLNIGVLRPRCLFICDVIPSQHSVDRLRFFKLQMFPNFLPNLTWFSWGPLTNISSTYNVPSKPHLGIMKLLGKLLGSTPPNVAITSANLWAQCPPDSGWPYRLFHNLVHGRCKWRRC